MKAENHRQKVWKKLRGGCHQEAKGGKSSSLGGGGSRVTRTGGGLRESHGICNERTQTSWLQQFPWGSGDRSQVTVGIGPKVGEERTVQVLFQKV